MRTPPVFHFSLIALLAAAALSACSGRSSQAPAEKLSDDFSVQLVDSRWVANAPVANGVSRAQCQALIAKAMCLTNATNADIDNDPARVQCLGSSGGYVQAAMLLFDEMPARLQPLFCSLNHIFISPNLESVAHVTAPYNQAGEVAGSYLNFRLDTFMHPPMVKDLMTWKEQQPFGGSPTFMVVDPKLVQVSYGLHLQRLAQDGLFYVLVHELGHLVDFNNGISRCHQSGICKFGDWAGISWQEPTVALAGVTYRDQGSFCFYNCQGHTLSADQAFDVYESLGQSAFVTTYSGVNEIEDFAESFAWYIMRQYKKPDYEITVPGRQVFSMNAAFVQNPVIVKKQTYMNALWNSPSLKMTNGPQ